MKRTIKITEEQLGRINELLDTTDSSGSGTPTVSVETSEPRRFTSADSEAVKKQIENGSSVTVKPKPLSEERKRGTKVVKLSQIFK